MKNISLSSPKSPQPLADPKLPGNLDLNALSPGSSVTASSAPAIDLSTASTSDTDFSYFTQPAMSTTQPFFTPSVVSTTVSLDPVSGHDSNMPLPTAPNPHFHLSLASAVAAATTGIPQTPLIPSTISNSSLKLPNFGNSKTFKKQRPPSLNLIEEQQNSKDASFVSETNSSSVQSSIISPPHSATETKSFMLLQARAARERAASLSPQNIKYTAMSDTLQSTSINSMIPHLIQKQQQHKLRSPSLPVNTLSAGLDFSPDMHGMAAEELRSLLEHSSGTTLVVDVRPFTQYANSRIVGAVNICIPSTLLKRPAFGLARFGECMLPAQRAVLENLEQYETIIFYDQATLNITSSQYSAIMFTLLKFHKFVKSKLFFLRGGLAVFESTQLEFVDKSPVVVDNHFNNGVAVSNENDVTISNLNDADSANLSSHGYSNSQPNNLRLTSSQTFNFPPVLTGFSLPASATKDGPMKPFASSVNHFMDHDDLMKTTSPIDLPPDLSTEEVSRYFPLWLQTIIDPVTGPRTIARRFFDIEQAEKIRLQGAFKRGLQAEQSPLPEKASATSEDDIKYSFFAGVELGSKNRYHNIFPYDHTRVKLTDFGASDDEILPVVELQAPKLNSASDYFNANYITTNDVALRYIATQGPLPDTFDDFWKVVWAKRVPVIVMLTTEIEGGATKCHKYWVPGIYGALSLTKVSSERVLLSERTGSAITLRKFVLEPTAVALASGAFGPDAAAAVGVSDPPQHVLYQLQYTEWPDLGSSSPEDLLELCRIKNECLRQHARTLRESGGSAALAADSQDSPWVVVHCSAGCGRTGTFCTVDSVIHLLETQFNQAVATANNVNGASNNNNNSSKSSIAISRNSDGENDGVVKISPFHAGQTQAESPFESKDLVYRTVHNFRRQRLAMVQILRQYELCYEAVILWVHNRFKDRGYL